MEVIVPSDAHQAELALDYALTRKNPVYIRLNRNAMPDIDTDRDTFMAGKAIKMREGKDITIAANGITASYAMEAAEALSKEGIEAEVFSVPFIKPLDAESLFASAEKTGRLLTVEEHLLAGGFASSLAEVAFKRGLNAKVDNIAFEDKFGETGPYIDLLAKYGISKENIVERAKALIK